MSILVFHFICCKFVMCILFYWTLQKSLKHFLNLKLCFLFFQIMVREILHAYSLLCSYPAKYVKLFLKDWIIELKSLCQRVSFLHPFSFSISTYFFYNYLFWVALQLYHWPVVYICTGKCIYCNAYIVILHP